MSTTLRSLAAFSLGALLAVPTAARAVNLTLEATKSDGRRGPRLRRARLGRPEGRRHAERPRSGTAAAPRSRRTAARRCPTRRSRCTATRRPTCRITYRALVFALDNVDPIRDGALYCCDFEHDRATRTCCAVSFDRLGVSDPVGNALPIVGPAAAALPRHRRRRAGRRRAAAPPARRRRRSPATPWLWIGLIGAAVLVAVLLAARKRELDPGAAAVGVSGRVGAGGSAAWRPCAAQQ